MNKGYRPRSNPTKNQNPNPNPTNIPEAPELNPEFNNPLTGYVNTNILELLQVSERQKETIKSQREEISALKLEIFQLKNDNETRELSNETYRHENAELLKKLQELQGTQIKDRTAANLAHFNENIQVSRSKSLIDANSNALKTIEDMGKEIANNRSEISKLTQENLIYKAREKENNNVLLGDELNNKSEEIYKIKNDNERLKSNLKNLEATNKDLQKEIKTTKKEIRRCDRENKKLKTQIESYNKEYESISFFNWLSDPLISKIEARRQTNKNKELTRNIDTYKDLYKSVFGKFDSYKKNISAWIDNNFKSYCNYINTIADVSEYNKDVIEDLLKLIDEIETWVIDLIVEYENKLNTNKTKTTIKSDVTSEVERKKVGKKKKGLDVPKKPELIDPPVPPNLTDAEKLLNAPKESEKRAEPSK